MKPILMCFHFLIKEVKHLEGIIKELNETIYKLKVQNFTYERKIKDLDETLERYKQIVSNGYI